MKRPSSKELFGKIREAKNAVESETVFLLDPDVIVEDAIELGYDIGDELFVILSELLDETSVNQYAGSRPPQKSYKQDIQGLELFAFVVDCCRFKCRIYYKFAFKEGVFWLVSLHRDQPKGETL